MHFLLDRHVAGQLQRRELLRTVQEPADRRSHGGTELRSVIRRRTCGVGVTASTESAFKKAKCDLWDRLRN